MPLLALLLENSIAVKLSIGLLSELAKQQDYPHRNKKLSQCSRIRLGMS
jgi:hypothetical protein